LLKVFEQGNILAVATTGHVHEHDGSAYEMPVLIFEDGGIALWLGLELLDWPPIDREAAASVPTSTTRPAER